MDQPDLIKVEAVVEREIKADRADLFVTIRGSSLVTGQAALNKAREVAQLVSDLETVGIRQDAIQVQGVSAEVTSGLISKASSATYSLRVRAANLDTLPEVIGAITSQKNTRLSRIEWLYPDNDTLRDELMRLVIEQAQKKARTIAGAFGIQLLGVLGFDETFLDPEERGDQTMNFSDSFDGAMRARTVSSEELGLQVSHSKSVSLRLLVQYRVSGFTLSESTI